MKTLMSGLVMVESPRWHDGRLWFAHWLTHDVVAVDLDGKSEVVARSPIPIPFSIDWLPDGRLLVIAGTRLLRQEEDGTLVEHADLSEVNGGRGFNELVVDRRGNAYVNGAGFDMMAGEAPAPGFVVLVTPDGEVRTVAGGIQFGNGMAITPDGSTLIVADSYANCLLAFDIAADGSLSGRRVWADAGDGVPDGICLDAEGAVWYADVPNKHVRRVREGGEVLQTIDFDDGCFACMLGGEDGRTLFVLTSVWRGVEGATGDQERTGRVRMVEVAVPHAGRP
ncbi:SMP-30/gluconolactonase/LRE family protein [Actinomadura barringtoniae]|uniref:SMP-30/gluconolactonase/LRE family protein n=1 Tax=Actinomadura barringtoniae TaxID=1427535 RepID=A0A939T5K5_9ACTN|nr:SMP-30/gluconolactonase/LRE family protein [Actinomadura barringtoniae]MBO2449634.1 SMP-30/gluconolactonase/LRE family protein [Actinomadura barringtoniae]